MTESRRFKVVLERDPNESVWVTYVPSLNHLSTFGTTREDALEQTREAILGYFGAAAKEHLTVPPRMRNLSSSSSWSRWRDAGRRGRFIA